mgnify:CR=1 FL=1
MDTKDRALEGGSVGLQIGGEATDLVLLVMNDAGIDKLLSNRVSLGAELSVAAGPVGRDARAARGRGGQHDHGVVEGEAGEVARRLTFAGGIDFPRRQQASRSETAPDVDASR